jgi:hypothetical protein
VGLEEPYPANSTVQKLYNFRCHLQKLSILLGILLEARVGIEAKVRTGAIEFIGLNYQ